MDCAAQICLLFKTVWKQSTHMFQHQLRNTLKMLSFLKHPLLVRGHTLMFFVRPQTRCSDYQRFKTPRADLVRSLYHEWYPHSICVILNIWHGTMSFITKREAIDITREDSPQLGGDVSVSYGQHFVTKAGHQFPVDRIERYAIHTAFLASGEHSDLLTKACWNTMIVSSAAKPRGLIATLVTEWSTIHLRAFCPFHWRFSNVLIRFRSCIWWFICQSGRNAWKMTLNLHRCPSQTLGFETP